MKLKRIISAALAAVTMTAAAVSAWAEEDRAPIDLPLSERTFPSSFSGEYGTECTIADHIVYEYVTAEKDGMLNITIKTDYPVFKLTVSRIDYNERADYFVKFTDVKPYEENIKSEGGYGSAGIFGGYSQPQYIMGGKTKFRAYNKDYFYADYCYCEGTDEIIDWLHSTCGKHTNTFEGTLQYKVEPGNYLIAVEPTYQGYYGDYNKKCDARKYVDDADYFNITAAVAERQFYDINGDGKVNVKDATDLLKKIVAKTTTNSDDVNSDGKVNVKDVTALLKQITGAR